MTAPTPAPLAMAAHSLYYWDVTLGGSRTKFEQMKRVQHVSPEHLNRNVEEFNFRYN